MSYVNRLAKWLRQQGYQIKANRIALADLREVMGAIYRVPEWIVLEEYKVNLPYNYIQAIEDVDNAISRVPMPTSFSLAAYGKFLDQNGDIVVLDGIVYQFSMLGNPRNVAYAYKLFRNGEIVAKNADLRSIHEAKQMCSESARTIIEQELFDL